MSAWRDALAGVAICLIGGVVMALFLFVRPAKSPPPAQTVKENRIIAFEDKWRAAGMTVALAEPKRVPVETIVKPDIIIEGATTAPQAVTPVKIEMQMKRVRVAKRDVCRGRGKVYTKNGRSWRCKRHS